MAKSVFWKVYNTSKSS